MLKESKKVLPLKKQTPLYFNNKFTLDEINELREAFKVYEDENERINPKYIGKMFKDLGFESKQKSVIEMMEFLYTLEDDDHTVSFDQFLEGCLRYFGANSSQDELKDVFDMFTESETNNIITLSSFQAMLNNLGENMSDSESTHLFRKNAGEKMYLTYEDFLTIFK